MNNLFEDLKHEREKKENEIVKERERKWKDETLTYENWQETVKRFSSLVLPILEQLREAKYPGYSVVDCFSKIMLDQNHAFESEGTWQIGISSGYSEDTWWESKVRVELELDLQTIQPVGFICHRNGHRLVKAHKTLIESILRVADKIKEIPYAPVRADLSREDLINALKQLHPLGEAALT